METIYFGAASGVISFTITNSNLFDKFRECVANKSKFFGEMVQCFFCTGFWISAAICLIYQPNLINKIPVLDEMITYFIVCGISGVCGIILKLGFRYSEY